MSGSENIYRNKTSLQETQHIYNLTDENNNNKLFTFKIKRCMKRNIYKERGYADRQDYLEDVADEYGVDRNTVMYLAEMLGESEDFDGLLSTIDDFKYIGLI